MIPWYKVRFMDCLDEKKGLSSLPDKGVELGFTDPPWGVGIDKGQERIYQGRLLKWDKEKEYFKDGFDPEWNLKWFTELERVCEGIILVTSEKFKFWWIRNTDVRGDLIIHWINGFSSSPIARYSKKSTYLFYGKFKNRLLNDVINATLKWGFLREEKFIHPTPKGIEIAVPILKRLMPESLIDPFSGSGSYLKAADILGIKWFGYEINPIYKTDILKRLSKRTLDSYF